jgi:hypothetical protein
MHTLPPATLTQHVVDIPKYPQVDYGIFAQGQKANETVCPVICSGELVSATPTSCPVRRVQSALVRQGSLQYGTARQR